MKYSLKSKLTMSYILLALLLVGLVSLLSNVFLETQFKDYVIKQQESKNREVVRLISQQYRDSKSGWNTIAVGNIGVNALEQGMIIKVKDVNGKYLWDATVHNNGMCTQMLNHMAANMRSRYPNFKGGYTQSTYPMAINFKSVGTVEIGYYGPYYLSDNDLTFINTLNKMLVAVGMVSLLIALALGTFMARRLTTPIGRVITTAQQVSLGNFGDRVQENSSTTEIGLLTSTINNLAQTLEQQESLRKRLTGDLAHEIRTPLATLQSHMEAMIDGIWPADTPRLQSCHEEILRLTRLVGELEQLARVDRDNLVVHKTSFDLTELTQHVVQNFEADFAQKAVSLDSQGESGEITADRDKVSQILVNLLSNALKFTPQGGRVQVDITLDATQAWVLVRDNGQGIPPDDLPHIFERFYRADKSRNRLTGGSGIGLSIVKSLVEAHHGSVTVVSKLGEGTEFTVKLPRKTG